MHCCACPSPWASSPWGSPMSALFFLGAACHRLQHHSSALHTRAALVPKAARRRGGSTGLRMRLLAQGLTHGPHPQLPAGPQGFLSLPPHFPPYHTRLCGHGPSASLPQTQAAWPTGTALTARREQHRRAAGRAGTAAQPEPVKGDTRCCQQRETPSGSVSFGFIRSRFFLEMNSERQKLSQRSHTRLS